MNAKKLVGIGLLGAMSLILSGCGGGSGGQAGVVPANPYLYGQGAYNQPINQPYTCQSGYIQFRNNFGRPQCYPTTVLGEACAQAGGILAANGTTCRKERPISGRMSGRYRTLFGTYPVSIPLRIQLFAGEALKVYGNVDSMNSKAIDWTAQLLQNGMSVGSASSGSMMSADGLNNFSITAITSSVQQNYYQNGAYNNGQAQYGGQYGYGAPYAGTQFGYGAQVQYGGQFQSQYGDMGTIQNFSIEFLIRGAVRIDLNGAAVSCEDGRGNSYPCQ